MLKKELRDIFKPAAGILSILSIVPLLALLNVSLHGTLYLVTVRVYRILKAVNGNMYVLSFLFLLGVLVLWIANILGLSSFKYEYKDKAFEYLFSFPVSKYRILRDKLLSRFVVLAVLVAIYEVLALLFFVELRPVQGSLFFFFDPVFFPVWALFFFLASFFIGLFEQKNWIAVISLVTFMGTILTSLAVQTLIKASGTAALRGSNLNGISFLLGTLIILGILGTAFFTVYKKFDMKSSGIHSRRFTLLTLPPLLFLIIAGFFILL